MSKKAATCRAPIECLAELYRACHYGRHTWAALTVSKPLSDRRTVGPIRELDVAGTRLSESIPASRPAHNSATVGTAEPVPTASSTECDNKWAPDLPCVVLLAATELRLPSSSLTQEACPVSGTRRRQGRAEVQPNRDGLSTKGTSATSVRSQRRMMRCLRSRRARCNRGIL